MLSATLKQIGCPVCRDEMAEDDERHCEECGRKVCTACVIPFDINDTPLCSRDDTCYFVCNKCIVRIAESAEKREIAGARK